MNLNKIQIIGRLTKAPEIKSTPGGTHVCSFSVATGHTFKDKEGQKQEKTTFHNVVTFGKTAETIAKYFVKGQEIYIEGRQEHRTYEKADGGKGYASEIICERFDFGQKPKGSESQGVSESKGEVEEEIDPDDIPF